MGRWLHLNTQAQCTLCKAGHQEDMPLFVLLLGENKKKVKAEFGAGTQNNINSDCYIMTLMADSSILYS